jgi:3',5'-cyclic AMP phosphodiesterase CpdA
MFTLAHLSDIHLAPLPRPALHQLLSKRVLGYLNWLHRRAQHRRDVLDRLLGDLLAQSPDHIALTGDLVNIALPEEFRLAKLWLESVGEPDFITVIPGNHDAYVPFLRDRNIWHWEPYMRANEAGQRFVNGHASAFPFVRLYGDIALVCLSSARATMPGMASGRVGWPQMASLGPILDELRESGYCRVVLIHHPPLPGMAPWLRALHDAGPFRELLVRHGAELVLHGHNHRAMTAKLETNTGPLPIVGVPSASISSHEPSKQARYNLYSFERYGNGSWRIEMLGRVFDHEGRATEVQERLLG